VPRSIDTAELHRMLDVGQVQLVEVLPDAEYELEHLPGARHIALTGMNRRSVRDLDPARPVVAYCFDYQ
jgi:rhodanese-related sulfurtransferase